jgi:hypothetical protein
MIDQLFRKGKIMRFRLMLFVCLIMINFIALAENEQADFGYWRLKSGNYEYSVLQTVYSNSTVCSGWSYSMVLALSISNMSDRVEVTFHKVVSENGVGIGPKLKDGLEKEKHQLEMVKGTYTVEGVDNKLEVVKSDSPFSDAFLGQMRNLLSYPTPRKLTENITWTNSAVSFGSCTPQVLAVRNGGNQHLIISSASSKEGDGLKQDKLPASRFGEPCIMVDQKSDQISLITYSVTIDKVMSNKQTLKFVGDIQKEPKVTK